MNLRAVVTVLAGVALAGCGGDDEPAAPEQGGDATSGTEAPSTVAPTRPDEASAGGRDAGEDERAAATPLVRQFRAIRDGNARQACAQFSAGGRRSFERNLGGLADGGGSCEDVILHLQVPEGDVTGVEIDGDRARVVVGGELEYDVERIDGEWKLAG